MQCTLVIAVGNIDQFKLFPGNKMMLKPKPEWFAANRNI